MAAKVSHKKTHKFKHKRAVRKKHKPIKKMAITSELNKEEREVEENIVSPQKPIAERGFESANTVIQRPQQASLESEASPMISSIPSEKPKMEDSKEKPTQAVSPEQASGVKPAVSAENTDQNAGMMPPVQNMEPERKKSKLWIILAFVVILAIVGGGLYYFRQEILLKSVEELKEELTPTPSEVSQPPELEEEATSSADIKADTSEFSIKVLNGSGVAGVAASTRDILEEADFFVEEIGNAETSDYEKTVIKAKKNVSEEFLDLLREELGKVYLLNTNEELEDSEDVDVVVIIGSEEV